VNWFIAGKLVIGVAACSAVLLGLALLVAPQATLRLSARFGRHDPLAPLLSWCDERRFVERYVYRHHHLVGTAVMLGAIYAGYGLLQAPQPAPDSWAALVVIALARFLLIANIMLVFVGALIFVRPSALKGVERWSNRWVAVPFPAQEVREAWIEHNPRVVGAIFLIAGVYFVGLVTFR